MCLMTNSLRENNMSVSIIIPIYNAEIYLPYCLDTIRNQTYKDLEVILVNDGSTDDSGKICDEYSKKDNKFIVIHKKNGGVSSARNAGLKIAKGRYIGFVDPDDWMEPNIVENLYKLITNNDADMSCCGYYKEDIEGKIINKTSGADPMRINNKEVLNNILNPNGYYSFVWNKLFSSNIIKKNRIYFDEDIQFGEDLLFCCEYLTHSNIIIYDSTPYYHYIIHNDNITKSQFSYKKITYLTALEKISNLLSDLKDVNVSNFKTNYIRINISILMHAIEQKENNSEIISMLNNNLYKYKLRDLNNNKVKLSSLIGRVNIRLLYFLWKLLK